MDNYEKQYLAERSAERIKIDNERKRIEKEKKKIEDDRRNEVLEKVDNGIYELFIFSDGQSNAWERFWKIRDPKTGDLVEYVQCMERKCLLPFKQFSGTTHLNRHRCRAIRGRLNDDGTLKYRSVSEEKADELKTAITKEIIKVCAVDLISPDILCSSVFKQLYQTILSMGSKEGNVRVDNFCPDTCFVQQEMIDTKEESLRESYFKFREAMKNEWCSATIEVRKFILSRPIVVLIMSVQFFEPNLKSLTKNVIFTTRFEESESSLTVLDQIIDKFKLFGGDDQAMQNIKIVTPNVDIMHNALAFPYKRYNCAADAINNILDDAFKSSASKDIQDLINNCRSIVSVSEKYNLKLNVDTGKWQSKIGMIRSIIEKYDDIVKILENERKTLFKINKRRAEELISFLELFDEAIEDLSSTSYTTANKILPWYVYLIRHLEECDEYSFDVKRIMMNTKIIFERNFQPTMDNKIDCFLDPRYKSLVMLNQNDRDEVMAETRNLMGCEADDCVMDPLPGPSTIGQSKEDRFAIFEKSSKSTTSKNAKRYRFDCYETNATNSKQKDEVDVYLELPKVNSKTFRSEFGIISEFWKSRKNSLPKLYKLATTRLHFPACCGTEMGDANVNRTVDIDTLSDMLLIGGNLKQEK